MGHSESMFCRLDPFGVLGLPSDASEEVVRARYLELVKKHPPDREPEKFQSIQDAYDLAKNPLKLANKLLDLSCLPDVPRWEEVIERHEAGSPKISLEFLLALGNKESK